MRRAIILGASNVTLAFPQLWNGLRRGWNQPLELFAAHGHGRSFGMWNRIGPRELPGLLNCRLWDELTSQPSSNEPPDALVTDVGNDLLYGVEPEQISEWVAGCLDRLQSIGARVVLTQLPLASVLSLKRRRFQMVKSVLFPGSRFRFEDVATQGVRLNELLLELGRSRGIATPELRREWYGFDPIHIRRRHRALAWQELLNTWFDGRDAARFDRVGTTNAIHIWRQRPFERRWFGREQNAAQPALREADGSTLWLY